MKYKSFCIILFKIKCLYLFIFYRSVSPNISPQLTQRTSRGVHRKDSLGTTSSNKEHTFEKSDQV